MAGKYFACTTTEAHAEVYTVQAYTCVPPFSSHCLMLEQTV